MAGTAAESAWLMARAPWEPPLTSSVGRSGSRPKRFLASVRVIPGRVMLRFIGIPIRFPPRIRVSGKV